MKTLIGKKIEMSQIFNEEAGKVVPVTLLEVGPCTVTQVKTAEKDGYQAIQIGYRAIQKENKKKKSARGKEFAILREVRTEGEEPKSVGDTIDVTAFEPGDQLIVSGISKGKGFQGAVKRWGFAGRNASHGVKHENRTLGSTGSQFPQRVIKGRKMPGQTGREKTTVRFLEVVKVFPEQHVIAVKGAVPGPRGSIITIQSKV